MPTRQLYSGRKYIIYDWIEDGCAPFQDFLTALNKSHTALCGSLLALILRIANEGPPENDELCRLADPTRDNNLYILISLGRICVFWFYVGNSIVICRAVNVSKNGNLKKTEMDKAILTKQAFLKEINYE